VSRRRQSYRPYLPVTQEALNAARYGTQARRMDRSHLRLIHSEQAATDDLVGTPYWWLALIVAVGLGVVLMPLAYCGVLVACWIAEAVR
jgi:hypothetical protein